MATKTYQSPQLPDTRFHCVRAPPIPVLLTRVPVSLSSAVEPMTDDGATPDEIEVAHIMINELRVPVVSSPINYDDDDDDDITSTYNTTTLTTEWNWSSARAAQAQSNVEAEASERHHDTRGIGAEAGYGEMNLPYPSICKRRRTGRGPSERTATGHAHGEGDVCDIGSPMSRSATTTNGMMERLARSSSLRSSVSRQGASHTYITRTATLRTANKHVSE